MEKDYKDLFEEGIVRLQEKMATLDPTSDEYRKLSECLVSQIKAKTEQEKNEAEVKLKERHEENEEVMTEREYEETLKKNRNDLKMLIAKIGADVVLFGAGMIFNGFWAGRYWGLEQVGTPSTNWLRDFFRNHTRMKTQ